MENILAIDIGGTSVKIGVINNSKVLQSTSIRNVFKGKPEKLINGIKSVCDKYIEEYDIKKIGIGCPGDIIDGVVVLASNLGWKDYKILDDFKKHYPDMEIRVDNDGNTACNAEIMFGRLKDVSNGVFITIGRGVGGAIIIDGKTLKGENNMAGKMGHMVIHHKGRKCNCGRRGCLETYISVSGLIQTVKECNSKPANEEDKIETDKLSGFQIVHHYKEGNKMIQQAVNKWHYDMIEGILNLCNLFDPSIIVVAGGITEGSLVNVDYINKTLVNNGFDKCKLYLATFKGKTGLIGAASLYSK